jgi:hypothetical protein
MPGQSWTGKSFCEIDECPVSRQPLQLRPSSAADQHKLLQLSKWLTLLGACSAAALQLLLWDQSDNRAILAALRLYQVPHHVFLSTNIAAVPLAQPAAVH